MKDFKIAFWAILLVSVGGLGTCASLALGCSPAAQTNDVDVARYTAEQIACVEREPTDACRADAGACRARIDACRSEARSRAGIK